MDSSEESITAPLDSTSSFYEKVCLINYRINWQDASTVVVRGSRGINDIASIDDIVALAVASTNGIA